MTISSSQMVSVLDHAVDEKCSAPLSTRVWSVRSTNTQLQTELVSSVVILSGPVDNVNGAPRRTRCSASNVIPTSLLTILSSKVEATNIGKTSFSTMRLLESLTRTSSLCSILIIPNQVRAINPVSVLSTMILILNQQRLLSVTIEQSTLRDRLKNVEIDANLVKALDLTFVNIVEKLTGFRMTDLVDRTLENALTVTSCLTRSLVYGANTVTSLYLMTMKMLMVAWLTVQRMEALKCRLQTEAMRFRCH